MNSYAVATAIVAIFSLSACDAATEIAGDAIAAEARSQYLAQCESVAESVGIPAERVTTACDCTADDFANDLAEGQLQIDRARIEEVLKICVQEQLGSLSGAPAVNSNR